MKEDTSSCPETTLTLYFNYATKAETGLFEEHISRIDVLLFTSEMMLYRHETIPVSSLGEFRETTLWVDPDDYYVVAWANSPLEARFTSTEEHTGFETILYRHNPSLGSIGTLCYAPDIRTKNKNTEDYNFYKVEVPYGENSEHILPFMSAYHTIRVYVKGVKATVGPTIYIDKLAESYSYQLETVRESGMLLNQTTETVEIAGEIYRVASIEVPHFQNENDIMVRVGGEHFFSNDEISLSEFMKDHDITVTDGESSVIEILFEYDEFVLVEVKFPSWEGTPVEGGFNK